MRAGGGEDFASGPAEYSSWGFALAHERLTEVGPWKRSRVTKTPMATKRSTRELASGGLLATAEAATARGDRAGTIGPLLALWAIAPSPAVADAIATVGGPGPDVAPLTGKTKAARQAWTEMASRRDPLELPALLATWTSDSANIAKARLATLADGPADPRIDAAIADVLSRVPYTYYGSRPFWYAVLDRVLHVRDPRVLDVLSKARAAFEKFGTGIRPAMVRRLERAFGELAKRLPLPAALPADAAPRLAAIVTRFAKPPKPSAGVYTREALLAAIFDDPRSDDPRLVYADFLQQRQDPHGELIAIQLRAAHAKLDAAARAREKELLARHGASFLGPLHDIVQRRNLRFARGFVDRCTVYPSCRDHIGDPWWSTVRELDGGAIELVTHPVMRHLVSLVIYHHAWKQLAAGHLSSLQRLDCRLRATTRSRAWDADARALGAGDGFPALTSLSIVVDQEYAGWRPSIDDYRPILTGTLAKRLEHLRIECHHLPHDQSPAAPRSIGAWLDELRAIELAVPVLELDDGIRGAAVVYRFERDADGRHRLRAIETRYGRSEDEGLIEILVGHLGGLGRDDVAALAFRCHGGKLAAASRARIATAARRFGIEPTGL